MKKRPAKSAPGKSKRSKGEGKYSNVLFQVLSTGNIRAELAVYFTTLAQQGATVSIFLGHSGYMPSDRNNAINKWLDRGTEQYIVQCDQDMIPPVDVLKMTRHKKDFVGCSYLCGSDRGPMLAAAPLLGTNTPAFPKASPSDPDLVEVEWVGTGCYSLSRDAALRMKAAQGGRVFDFEFTEDGSKKTGVDILLCRRMREIGMKVWLDRGCVAGHAKAMSWAPSADGRLKCLPWGTYWAGDEVPEAKTDRIPISELLTRI